MYSATASNPNSFDTDLAPAHPPQSSADTSVSSVATEPHTVMAEPSTRRRVSPIAEVLVCEPRPKQNNPYMYNVLGANASPDLAARTSPIPPAPLSPTQQQAHNASYGDISTAYEMDPAAHWQPNAPTAAVTRPLPVLGGYMAARYTSAFPPGQLPVLQQQQPPVAVAPRAASPLEQPQDVGAQGSSRRRNSRRTVAASTLTLSDDSPRSPLSPAPTPSSPTTNSPTSTFKVMYRNGRPVPVPATANATAPAAATAPA